MVQTDPMAGWPTFPSPNQYQELNCVWHKMKRQWAYCLTAKGERTVHYLFFKKLSSEQQEKNDFSPLLSISIEAYQKKYMKARMHRAWVGTTSFGRKIGWIQRPQWRGQWSSSLKWVGLCFSSWFNVLKLYDKRLSYFTLLPDKQQQKTTLPIITSGKLANVVTWPAEGSWQMPKVPHSGILEFNLTSIWNNSA